MEIGSGTGFDAEPVPVFWCVGQLLAPQNASWKCPRASHYLFAADNPRSLDQFVWGFGDTTRGTMLPSFQLSLPNPVCGLGEGVVRTVRISSLLFETDKCPHNSG